MWEKSGFSNITHIIVVMYFTTFEGLIKYRNTRIQATLFLKGLIAAVFESSELLRLLRLHLLGLMGAIPT